MFRHNYNDVLECKDYDPFGMLMSGRNWSVGSEYRYGFNQQEQVDEVYGNGNLNTANFWEYDTRLGRRWNVDPVINHSCSPFSVLLNNGILFNDVDGNVVGYEKFSDKLRVSWNRLTNRTFRANFNNWNSDPTTLYTFKKRNSNPILPNATATSPVAGANGNLATSDILYSTNGQVGGGIHVTLVKKNIDLGWKKYVVVNDNNTNNQPTTYTLDRLIPGTAITFDPLDHPDEFTLTDPNGNQLYQATQVIPVKDQQSFLNQPGFAPIIDVSGSVTNRQYIVPSGISTITLTQRSQSQWPYIDTNGNNQVHNKPNSNWTVGYWQYRKINLKFTLIIPKITF